MCILNSQQTYHQTKISNLWVFNVNVFFFVFKGTKGGSNENREGNLIQNIFQLIEYPLGKKSSKGKWKACAFPIDYFNMEKVKIPIIF